MGEAGGRYHSILCVNPVIIVCALLPAGKQYGILSISCILPLLDCLFPGCDRKKCLLLFRTITSHLRAVLPTGEQFLPVLPRLLVFIREGGRETIPWPSPEEQLYLFDLLPAWEEYQILLPLLPLFVGLRLGERQGEGMKASSVSFALLPARKQYLIIFQNSPTTGLSFPQV